MRWENGLILAIALANIAYNATLPLHYDEAYYWVWTQRLDFSYFDHPPMIAWLLWVVGQVGQTEAVLRSLLHAAAIDGRGARDLYRWSLDPVACADAVAPRGAMAVGGPTTLTRITRLADTPSMSLTVVVYLGAAAILIVPTLAVAIPWLTELSRLIAAAN